MTASSPNTDRGELIAELCELVENMTERDAEMMLEMARRLGR